MRSSSGCVAAASGTSCPRKSSLTTPRCTALCRGGSSLACSISSGRSSSRSARNSAEWTSSGRPPMGPWARHALGGSRRPQSHRQSQKRAQTLPAGRGRWRSSFGGDSRSERARLQAVGGHARSPIVVGWPAPNEQAPCYEHLCLDKGYDKAPAREIVEQRGYVPHIRKIGEEKLDDAGVKRYPALGGGTYTGLAVEMPGHTGTLRQEGCQLPGADQGGLHPAVVSASASSIPFEIVCKQLGQVPDLRFCQSDRLVPTFSGCGVLSGRVSNESGPPSCPSCRASSGHPRSARSSSRETTGPSDPKAHFLQGHRLVYAEVGG